MGPGGRAGGHPEAMIGQFLRENGMIKNTTSEGTLKLLSDQRGGAVGPNEKKVVDKWNAMGRINCALSATAPYIQTIMAATEYAHHTNYGTLATIFAGCRNNAFRRDFPSLPCSQVSLSIGPLPDQGEISNSHYRWKAIRRIDVSLKSIVRVIRKMVATPNKMDSVDFGQLSVAFADMRDNAKIAREWGHKIREDLDRDYVNSVYSKPRFEDCSSYAG